MPATFIRSGRTRSARLPAAPERAKPERLFALRELSELGYGSRRTNLNLINAGLLPAVCVGTPFKVRESDLALLAAPIGLATSALIEPKAEVFDSLAVAASQLVLAWPRLDPNLRDDLPQLLAAA
jgi:hypothetical protein